MRATRAAKVLRKKAERREQRAKRQSARESYQTPAFSSRQSTLIPALLAAGLIGYFGDIEELRTDMQPFL
jgi:hypothetical protein